MTHATELWREYVRSACEERTDVNDRLGLFEMHVAFGFGGETAAYKALDGVMYAHKYALRKAYEACMKKVA